MPGDWLKLYRKTRDSAVFENDSLWRLWGYLLMNANWDGRQLADGTVLEPGQMVRGCRRIAKDLGWSRSRVARWTGTLTRLGNIQTRQRSGTLAQVITICNWETYQGGGDASGTQAGRKRDILRDLERV